MQSSVRQKPPVSTVIDNEQGIIIKGLLLVLLKLLEQRVKRILGWNGVHLVVAEVERPECILEINKFIVDIHVIV